MKIQLHTKLCLEQFNKCLSLKGDIVEFGVAFGNTTFPLAKEAQKVNKSIFAFDTFEGIPYDDSIKNEAYVKKGECRGYNIDRFIEEASKHRYYNVIPVKGLFEDTTKNIVIPNICFAWIDSDIYQSTKTAWEFVEKRLVKDGIVGFHDYNFPRCPGVKMVVDTIDKETFQIVQQQSICIFLKRVK